MSDLVERLRKISRTPGTELPDTAREAADEIERQKVDNQEIMRINNSLRDALLEIRALIDIVIR